MIINEISIQEKQRNRNRKIWSVVLFTFLPILGFTSYYINQCHFNNVNSNIELCPISKMITPNGYYHHYQISNNNNNFTANVYYYFSYISNDNLLQIICDENNNIPEIFLNNSINKYKYGQEKTLYINFNTNKCILNQPPEIDSIGAVIMLFGTTIPIVMILLSCFKIHVFCD